MKRHSDLDFGGPAYSPDIFGPDGRLTKFCKGGGSNQAQEAAEASRRQAKLQHEENMRNLRKQARVAAEAKAPEFTPASPPAAASEDVSQAGMSQRRKALRRFGFNSTISANTLGTMQALGM